MAYVGGKSMSSQFIIDILNNPKYDAMHYIEPFVGYCHILRRIIKKGSYSASDSNALLVRLLHGIQNGEHIPDNISRDEYNYHLSSEGINLRSAVACFAYSYNGKPWGGYCPTNKTGTRNYVNERIRYYKTLLKNDTFMKTKLYCNDYKKWNPVGCLIYCDPPYFGTTTSKKFDTEIFWAVVRHWSRNNTVFVSGYEAPDDFICVGKSEKQCSLNGKHSQRTEKLFSLS